ncbi:MAG: ATP-grasp domain-containing protein [Sulfurimonas sp.]|jgi:glutathione synthase/RimK-type ligase-like ATP-grasp enzyme
MILLWGPINDQPLEYVKRELDRLNEPYFLIDQHKILDYEIRLVVSSSINEAYIKNKDRIIDLKEIHSVYLRPHDSTQVDCIVNEGVDSDAFRHAVYFDEIMYTWLELTDCFIINKLSDMASNSSKPYQTELIRQIGMKTPKTILSTDKKEVKKFHKTHKQIIYKSMSGIRSIISKLDENAYDRLENIKWCPTQFQEYIKGVDYRVHVVKDTVFSCKIETDTDDYRYSTKQGGFTKITVAKIPNEIKEVCIKISQILGLTVVGIDLRKTADGAWYCFEANPSPGFSYYEAHTGLPIANAIAKLLIYSST